MAEPPPMSAATRTRALDAIAGILTARGEGVQWIVYDGRPLEPGARLLPVAHLEENEPVGRVAIARPIDRGENFDAIDK